jgi:hypothetical protein
LALLCISCYLRIVYFEGTLNPEDCICVEDNLLNWYKNTHCNQTYSQIERDFSAFNSEKIDMEIYAPEIIKRFDKRYSQSLCNYVVLNNRVFFLIIFRNNLKKNALYFSHHQKRFIRNVLANM